MNESILLLFSIVASVVSGALYARTCVVTGTRWHPEILFGAAGIVLTPFVVGYFGRYPMPSLIDVLVGCPGVFAIGMGLGIFAWKRML